MTLVGKVALVTGGAGGLGEAICYALAHAGVSVVVGYNKSAAASEALAASLPLASMPHLARPAPVTDSTALKTLATEIESYYGRCDILLNCAGTTRFVPHSDLNGLDDTLIDQILTTNVRGVFATTRAFVKLLAQHNNGVIVNISSIAAVTVMGSNVMYCASKAAVDNMTKSLARALAPAIRVVSVSPGLVDTEFVKSMDKSWRDEQSSRTPLQRLATPEEVANTVIAAINLTFTTGAIIPVDGGRPLT